MTSTRRQHLAAPPQANVTRIDSEGRPVGWSARPLQPQAPRPPGLSRLPAPRRTSATGSAAQLPARVATYSEVPARYRQLYDAGDGGYALNQVGAVLAKYRSSVELDPTRPYVWRAGKKPGLSKRQWATLIGIATPGAEREFLLKAGALKHITIKD
jgi:hypothetical protein